MIAKIKRNTSLGDTIDYNLKEESQLIDSYNLNGDTIEDYSLQMELTQKLFTGRAKNLTAHIILSPSIEDGEKLTLEMCKEIAYRYLVRMELDKNQALVFLHDDKNHVHLHVVVNRINKEGEIYRTHENEMLKSQRSGNIIAKELGMRQAGSKGIAVTPVENEINDETGLMSQIRQDCSSAKLLAGPPSNPKFILDKYFDLLKKKGYTVKKYHHSKTKVIYGYGIAGSDNHFYKASSIGEAFSIKNLIAQSNTVLQENLKEQITKDLNHLTNNIENFNTELYFIEIRKKGYQVKPHFERDSNGIETATMRGYSVGKDSVFFSASEMSPDLTLKKLRLLKPIKTPSPKQKEQSESDLEKIKTCIDNLTSGYRYEQTEDFITALEANKLKVNLRYSSGELSGYTLSIGSRKYKDSEINGGAYSIERLKANGILKTSSEFVYRKRALTTSELMKTSVDEINKKHIREAINHSKRKIPRRKILLEKDFSDFIQSIEHSGFKIKLHFVKDKNGLNTKQIRGYSIGIENDYYNASALGREYTISNLIRSTINVKLT